ncbi:MAG: YbaB/EbfC family nucleoid-associated protein [Planctomycetia bacterium]|nr:YbaB/EbfC family nucleoid-associated protein [Planctomycetia bacterium]
MFNGFGGISALLNYATNIEEQFLKLKNQLLEMKISVTAGNSEEGTEPGSVMVHTDGLGREIKVEVSEELLSPEHKERLEALLQEALGEAVQKVRVAIYEDAIDFAQKSGIPGLDKILANLK